MRVAKKYEAHCNAHGQLGLEFDDKEGAVEAIKEHMDDLYYKEKGDPSQCRCYVARAYVWEWD